MKNLLKAIFHKPSDKQNTPSAFVYGIYEVRMEDSSYGAVSILPHEEVFAKGLSSKAIVGIVPEDATEIAPERFKPNPEFIEFLHYVIKKYCPTRQELQDEAERQGDGWVYIIDSRADNPYGQVDAEDIVGAFQVQNGLAVANSYQPNVNFRLVSKRGLFRLDAWLQEKLLDEVRQSSN